MPIKPADFYSVADLLQNGKPVPAGEPCDRTILGRAYYASYLALRDSVRLAYNEPRADVGHSELRKGLSGADDAEVADVGGRLTTLWRMRRISDYQPEMRIEKTVLSLLLSNARFILGAAPRIVRKIPPGIPTKNG